MLAIWRQMAYISLIQVAFYALDRYFKKAITEITIRNTERKSGIELVSSTKRKKEKNQSAKRARSIDIDRLCISYAIKRDDEKERSSPRKGSCVLRIPLKGFSLFMAQVLYIHTTTTSWGEKEDRWLGRKGPINEVRHPSIASLITQLFFFSSQSRF